MQYINGDQLLVVCVEVEPHQWDWEAATTRKTRVGSAAATLRHGIGDNEQVYIGLTWQLKDGRWVTVESLGAISEAKLVRYAASLHPGSIPGTAPPISFGLVPPGLHLQDLDELGLCLAPQDRLTIRYRSTGLCILLLASVSAEFQPLGEKVRVNGHDAVLSDDGTELYVFLDEHHAYQVMIAGYPLDRETLLRVAAAVTIP